MDEHGSSLIIGGGNGLGLELARESSKLGIETIIVDKDFSGFEAERQKRQSDFLFTRQVVGNIVFPASLITTCLPFLERVRFLFLVAGNFARKPFKDMDWDEIDKLYRTHLFGPRMFLNSFHRFLLQARPLSDTPGRPYHLIMISSSTSWRIRDNQSIYSEVQAAKAHFTRQFAEELARDLPESKTTLICPGGIATPNFWKGIDQDLSNFMDPNEVARIILDVVSHQVSEFSEAHIINAPGGKPIVSFGSPTIETPFFQRTIKL